MEVLVRLCLAHGITCVRDAWMAGGVTGERGVDCAGITTGAINGNRAKALRKRNSCRQGCKRLREWLCELKGVKGVSPLTAYFPRIVLFDVIFDH